MIQRRMLTTYFYKISQTNKALQLYVCARTCVRVCVCVQLLLLLLIIINQKGMLNSFYTTSEINRLQ